MARNAATFVDPSGNALSFGEKRKKAGGEVKKSRPDKARNPLTAANGEAFHSHDIAAKLGRSITPKNKMAPGPSHVADVIRQVMDLVETRLGEKIAEGRGSLTGYSMSHLMTEMRAMEDPELVSIIDEGWKDINRAIAARAWDEGRTHPLFRMIVHKFSSLLATRDKPPQQGSNLSRRVIHPMMFALEQMNGPGFMEDYEEKCRDIVKQLKDHYGDSFCWDHVYQCEAANILADDVLVRVAHYFQDCAKRRAWMVSVFTHAMDQPHGHHHHNDEPEHWHFGNWEFHMIVRALYANVFAALDSPAKLKKLIQRYGEQTVGVLRSVRNSIEEDRRQFL